MNKYELKLLTINNIWAFGSGMLGPLFAVFTDQIGGNILDISWAWSIYLIVTGIGIIILGKLSDSLNKRNLILLGLLITTIFTFFYLLVNSPIDLLIVQIGFGLGLALFLPSWNALYDQYSGEGKNDGYVWGTAKGNWYLFSGLAIISGGLIVNQYSFNLLFLIMGFIHLFGFMLAFLILENK